MNGRRTSTTLFILAVFGIAMAHLEGVTVVYIRRVLGYENGGDFQGYLVNKGITTLEGFSAFFAGEKMLWIEMGREAATIVMLVCISLLVARNWRQFLAFFCWTFAIWDICYYLSLRLLVGWPRSLGDLDCVFLIPQPWFAPVYVPVIVMILLIIISLRMLAWDRKKETTEWP